jgi:hypothetical protein
MQPGQIFHVHLKFVLIAKDNTISGTIISFFNEIWSMKNLSLKSLLVIFILLNIIPSCVVDDDIVLPKEDRDAFLGIWEVTETCNRYSYEVEIVKDPTNSSQVLIRNFWLIGYDEKPPYAIVAGTNITIPSQGMCNDGSNIVEGSGTMNKKKIEWSYTVNDGADLYTCTATFEKP